MMNLQYSMNPAHAKVFWDSVDSLEDWYERAMDALDREFARGLSPKEYDRQCRELLREFNEEYAEICSD